MVILGQTVFEIFEALISRRTNEHKIAHHNSAFSPKNNRLRKINNKLFINRSSKRREMYQDQTLWFNRKLYNIVSASDLLANMAPEKCVHYISHCHQTERRERGHASNEAQKQYSPLYKEWMAILREMKHKNRMETSSHWLEQIFAFQSKSVNPAFELACVHITIDAK